MLQMAVATGDSDEHYVQRPGDGPFESSGTGAHPSASARFFCVPSIHIRLTAGTDPRARGDDGVRRSHGSGSFRP